MALFLFIKSVKLSTEILKLESFGMFSFVKFTVFDVAKIVKTAINSSPIPAILDA
ncbi:MAG: hypothetical protein GX102_07510 [Porphyromonadaceae bacterium]|nr:hypothetical protein [Porphyromonadaceae bacterium]